MKLLFVSILSVLSSFIAVAQNQPHGIAENQKAPDFTAKDQNGKMISLKAALKKGPVVVVFYRGQWCPYCNRELKMLEDSLSFFQAKGATVIAVTPEIQKNIEKTIEKTKATYSILYDDGLSIMKSYDVAFTLDSSMIGKFKGYGIDLNESNGANGNNLPVPAVYVINKEGMIVYRHFDPDYTKRATVKEILSHL
ncbi:MAG: peroxiredoxin-like family protein [Ferruginibacter sp.]